MAETKCVLTTGEIMDSDFIQQILNKCVANQLVIDLKSIQISKEFNGNITCPVLVPYPAEDMRESRDFDIPHSRL